MDYKQKYLKYKTKYLELKAQIGFAKKCEYSEGGVGTGCEHDEYCAKNGSCTDKKNIDEKCEQGKDYKCKTGLCQGRRQKDGSSVYKCTKYPDHNPAIARSKNRNRRNRRKV